MKNGVCASWEGSASDSYRPHLPLILLQYSFYKLFNYYFFYSALAAKDHFFILSILRCENLDKGLREFTSLALLVPTVKVLHAQRKVLS